MNKSRTKLSRIFAFRAVSLLLVTLMFSACAALSLLGTRAQVTTDMPDIFWDTALLQSVTKLTDDGLWKISPKASPDGVMLLYNEQSTAGSENIVLLRDVTLPAKTILIDGRNGNAFDPAWAGNNNNFVYVLRQGGSRSVEQSVVRTALAGAGRTFVTRNPVGRFDSRPSVRGNVILFDTETNNRRQLVSVLDNGTEITFLGDGYSPSWHPTLPRFLFVRDGNIFEMNMENFQVTQLYEDVSGRLSAFPSYSPDGQHIIFQQSVEERPSRRGAASFPSSADIVNTADRWQILIMRINGTGLTSVTFRDVNAFTPFWCSDNYIYFVAGVTGRHEIYRGRINLN